MSTVKQHGFLFKVAMVRANLREVDPKTNTRRVITFDNSITFPHVRREEWKDLRWDEAERGEKFFDKEERPLLVSGLTPFWHVPLRDLIILVCPRVLPGDIIWVRECWSPSVRGKEETPGYVNGIEYKADGEFVAMDISILKNQGWGWRSSLHLRREHSRTDLLVTAMRSERVQEISEADAKAEGAKMVPWYVPYGCTDEGQHRHVNGKEALITGPMACYRNGFATLWDSINAARGFGWAANPPVWVHVYKRVRP